MSNLKKSIGERLHSRAAAYQKDEAGSFVIFSLYIFVVMLMVGGLAVDLMRFEAERKHLQNTLDTAVLAAADLKQTSDSKTVVESFLEVSGFDPSVADINVENSTLQNGEVVGRTVGARSRLQMDTYLMGLAGVDTLSTNAGGSANENIQNVEISVVLDISGSMRWGLNNSNATPNRIDQLRDAVEDFVDIVLQVNCDADGNCTQSPNTASTTINIIPYAGHVNPGPDMFELMGGNRWHMWSSCMEVTDADFDDSTLPSDSSFQLPHFMKWSIDSSVMNWGWCPKDDAAIIVAENDAETLKNFVRNVRLHDGTATHIGMKYGVALLDPSSRWMFSALSSRGIVEADYAARPAEYNDEVVKYVVLMTDGQTTDQFRPNDFDYEDFYTDWAEFTAAWNDASCVDDGTGGGEGDGCTPGLDPDYEMPERLANWLDRYGSFDRNLDANAPADVEYGYNAGTKLELDSIIHSKSRNRSNLQAVCDYAKQPVTGIDESGNSVTLRDDRITVFTIAFLAPDGARADMRDCASGSTGTGTKSNFFFNVTTLDVGSAFTSIARTINQLRLTN